MYLIIKCILNIHACGPQWAAVSTYLPKVRVRLSNYEAKVYSHHLLMRVPPQCQNTRPPALSRRSSAIHGNSPSLVSSPPRTKAESPERPHWSLAGTQRGLELLVWSVLSVASSDSEGSAARQHTLRSCLLHTCLELETKVHTKGRNHGEGPYLGLRLVESTIVGAFSIIVKSS